MDRAGAACLRQPGARPAARRRNPALEARLVHPIFDPIRPWLARLEGERSLARLNALAEEAGLRTASGQPVRFVPPGKADPYYEIQVHQTGRVQTRPESLHDFFNALAWLAFPRAKARLNALHAEEIPRENGRRSRRRDLLTVLDEGGVLVSCRNPALASLIREMRWKALFWQERETVLRELRLIVFGHATLEQALAPWRGIACKAVFVPPEAEADAALAAWLQALPAEATPKDLPPLPIFGYPGWYPGNDFEQFYDDARTFREKRDKAAPSRPPPPPDDAGRRSP